jgi:hypothetical protein
MARSSVETLGGAEKWGAWQFETPQSTLEQPLEVWVREGVVPLSGVRAFQVEGTTSAKPW